MADESLNILMAEAIEKMKSTEMGNDYAIEVHRGFSGSQFVKLVELRYNGLGRQLKSAPLMGPVIVGEVPETLRAIADLLEGKVAMSDG
jgi:hypothetical protein